MAISKNKEQRELQVVKHNDLVRSRHRLTMVEQKAVAYVVSLIQPSSDQLEYSFQLADFCETAGLGVAGENYSKVRDAFKKLRDRSIWAEQEDGSITTLSWFYSVTMHPRTGKVTVHLDPKIVPYVLQLAAHTTRYELLSILPMTSKYSIRLYELCKSWAYKGSVQYDIAELRRMLMIDDNKLERYQDFRRYVLDVAMDEIRRYTDLEVQYDPVKDGRSYVAIRFNIRRKNDNDRIRAMHVAADDLDRPRDRDLGEDRMAKIQASWIRELGGKQTKWRERLSKLEQAYVSDLEDQLDQGATIGNLCAAALVTGKVKDHDLAKAISALQG